MHTIVARYNDRERELYSVYYVTDTQYNAQPLYSTTSNKHPYAPHTAHYIILTTQYSFYSVYYTLHIIPISGIPLKVVIYTILYTGNK